MSTTIHDYDIALKKYAYRYFLSKQDFFALHPSYLQSYNLGQIQSWNDIQAREYDHDGYGSPADSVYEYPDTGFEFRGPFVPGDQNHYYRASTKFEGMKFLFFLLREEITDEDRNLYIHTL